MSRRLRASGDVLADLAGAVFALATGLVMVAASVAPFGWHLSALVRMAPGDPLARLVASDPAWVFAGAHYDGIYFFAMALDPLAIGAPHQLLDLAAYRYGHPAYGWLAGLLALGNQPLIPLALVAVSVVSLGAAAFFGSRIARTLGLSRWTAVAIALCPGLLYAVGNDTSEALGAALMLAVLWAWLVGRRQTAGLLMIPMCFVKEPLVLVPAGIALWEAMGWWRWRRTEVRPGWLRTAVWVVPGPLAYAVWLAYLHGQFGVWSFSEGSNLALPLPLLGWLDSFGRAASMAAGPMWEQQVGQAALPLQVAILGVLLVAFNRALRLRSLLDPVYLLVALLMGYMSWVQILYPKDLLRCVAFALVLAALVLQRPSVDLPGRSATLAR